MEKVQQEMKNPSRFTFDPAAEHVYNLLLKKDCYPRFVRSEHYKTLLANALQPSQKKRSAQV
jgi:regulator of G-protein signaling